MTSTLELPTHVNLSSHAMLVDLTIRQWSAGKADHQATTAVETTFATDSHMGHYYKRLLGTDHLKPIRKAATKAYTEHMSRTLPWLDNGQRVLSSTGYFDYMSAINEAKNDFDDAVDKFVTDYPTLVAEAGRRLKGLFKPDEYPPSSAIRNRFELEVTVLPLPSSGDFRVDLTPQAMDRIQAQIDNFVAQATINAMTDVNQRIVQVVRHLYDRMTAYTGAKEGSFRNSVVENVQDLIDLLPSLNLTNSRELDQLRTEMQSLVSYDPDTLRNDETARLATAQAAEDILKKMQAYV